MLNPLQATPLQKEVSLKRTLLTPRVRVVLPAPSVRSRNEPAAGTGATGMPVGPMPPGTPLTTPVGSGEMVMLRVAPGSPPKKVQ